MKDFENWWHQEGSALHPLPTEDIEEFAKRITQIAWSNGVYKERDACAKVCEQIDTAAFGSERLAPNDCAAAIRARGN